MDAMQVAVNAQHTADLALKEQAGHERVCSERYANINTTLTEIKSAQAKANDNALQTTEKVYLAINEIRTQLTQTAIAAAGNSGKVSGADTVFKYACMLIAAGGVIFGFMK